MTHSKHRNYRIRTEVQESTVTYIYDTSLTANMKGPLLSSHSPICAKSYTYMRYKTQKIK